MGKNQSNFFPFWGLFEKPGVSKKNLRVGNSGTKNVKGRLQGKFRTIGAGLGRPHPAGKSPRECVSAESPKKRVGIWGGGDCEGTFRTKIGVWGNFKRIGAPFLPRPEKIQERRWLTGIS